MAKTARKHFETDCWQIIEKDFSPEFSRVSESVFSLGNEYMGARGFIDEGCGFPSLRGTYLNGIYEYASDSSATAYKGIATRTHFMVNAADFFDTEIMLDGVKLDMASVPFEDFERTLDLRTGKLTRRTVYKCGGKSLKAEFCRFFDMQRYTDAYQRIVFTSDVSAVLTLSANVRFDEKHFGQPSRWRETYNEGDFTECCTESTNQRVCVGCYCIMVGAECESLKADRFSGKKFTVTLRPGESVVFTRLVTVGKNRKGGSALSEVRKQLGTLCAEGYEKASARNESYWADFWKRSDITICGSDEDQQGIRFCIFQLQQTYHGAEKEDNIGAKGLTGEAYSGHAFWDTETYCLPYYLFNNIEAAKNLLEYRYTTLPQAEKRARDLDCKGACYPIATLNGEEGCTLWQHASLQMQPSTGVAYGIFLYSKVSGDKEFLYTHGAEMLIEICRYLASRGQWDPEHEYFGYYCVMGPDEFQMMVNHNTYTNYMAQKTFRFTLSVLEEMPEEFYGKVSEKTSLAPSEKEEWKLCADRMLILYDEKTMLYEQHDGFFKLPHVDVDSIPDTEFPLYSHWSYDRIYRNDMIKQPDVLMFQLLYSGDFSAECKKANYEYYEPRCIHESSLSPSVHSVIAAETGKYKEASDFFAFATRMDLDDYNRNTAEGLHTTSIAAAWLNVVYGFGGLRSDRELSVGPILPAKWEKYSFNITVDGCVLHFETDAKGVTVTNGSDKEVPLIIYGKKYYVKGRITVER